jgi:hypothetical protein
MSDVFGIGGVAQAAGSVAGAAIQANAISHAADQQAEAARNALDLQQRTTDYNQLIQRPFVQTGQNALTAQWNEAQNNQLGIDPLLKAQQASTPGAMTEAQLVQTPGYSFNLNQGLRATQNAAAARGLGISGAALRGAATYATGLADSTYQNQFANQQTRYMDATSNVQSALAAQNQRYNQWGAIAQMGENAATQSGTQGQAGAQNATNLLSGLGNSQGAASIASGNALAGGFNGVGNAVANQQALAAYKGGGSVYGNNDYVDSGSWGD